MPSWRAKKLEATALSSDCGRAVYSCCLQQRHQMRHQRLIGRRHRIIAQPVRAHPGELLPFLWHHRSLPAPADIERHQQMEIRIDVTGESERRQARFGDDDAELFLELADQGL